MNAHLEELDDTDASLPCSPNAVVLTKPIASR